MRNQKGETRLMEPTRRSPVTQSSKVETRNEEPKRRHQKWRAQEEKTGRRSQEGELRNKEPRRINHE